MIGQQAILGVLIIGLAACDSAPQADPVEVVPAVAAAPIAAGGGGAVPYAYGCWVVNADEVKVDGEWQYPCRVALPTTKLRLPSTIDWPDAALVLPAIEPGPIPQVTDRVEALLRAETASKGVAGLLFLPASRDGAGLYVAAWEGPSGDAGWSLGAYSAFPASVATPAGRAYLSPDFKRILRARRSVPADEEAAEEPVEPSTNELAPEGGAQGSRREPRPAALEL